MQPLRRLTSISAQLALALLYCGLAQAQPTGKSTDPPTGRTLFADWPKRETAPVELNATWIVDASQSLRGGLTTNRGAVRNLFELAVSASTEPLLGFSGGAVGLSFQNQAGRDGSRLSGDLQVFSNIDADGRSQLAELWYEHVFEDIPLRIRVGKVDANTQFAFVEHGIEFLQSSMGFSPTVFVLPTYPDPSPGINMFYGETEGFYAGIGIYDGSLAQGARPDPAGSTDCFAALTYS